ncbi:MAG: hypothetical protein COA50_07880 [Flavobacteriaceae bacterium]|nr:MAG: hypothetical protein COA50_07880 [Flavobacteriaceae bacterium]
MMSDLYLFFGRFHPLFVHLPIGFILIAAILEAYSILFKVKQELFSLSIKITLLVSFISSVLAVTLGLLLANKGGYDTEALSWHKWMGIGFTVLALLLWLTKAGYLNINKRINSLLLMGAILVISITGHYGGNLTHGSDYLLTYAPEVVKSIFGAEHKTDKKGATLPTSIDSIVVYAHLIQPLLEHKCYSCHNSTKAKGGLDLSNIDGIKKGGETGAVIYAGESDDSPLFNLTILPPKDPKFMPPKGEALTYAEIKMLQWWINAGASFENSIKETALTDEVIALLKRDYDVDVVPKPYYEEHPIAVLDSSVIGEMKRVGWAVKPLSSEVNYLQVSGKGKVMNARMLAALEKAKAHITWLDVSNMSLTDAVIQELGNLENLTQLLLNNNNITNAGLEQLQRLKRLEVLNLYNNSISDAGLQLLENNSALKKVYIWQTQVSVEGAEELKENIPSVEIIGGSLR